MVWAGMARPGPRLPLSLLWVEPVGAQSVFGAGQSLETVTHRVTIRWRDGVASGMRFVRQERVFEIVTVHDPDETSRYLVCRVREEGR